MRNITNRQFMTMVLNEKSVNSIIDFILTVYHIPAKHNLDRIEQDILRFDGEYGTEYAEAREIKNLFMQYKDEVLEHMSIEEHDLFKKLRLFDTFAEVDPHLSQQEIDEFRELIRKLHSEHEIFNTYSIQLSNILRNSRIRTENPYLYEHFQAYFSLIESETIRHSELEDKKLYPLAVEIFNNITHPKS